MEKLPSVLHNPGNFCYLNSLLQCLTHIKPIKQFFNRNMNFDSAIYSIINFFGINLNSNENSINSISEVIISELNSLYENNENNKKINEINKKYFENITFDLKPYFSNTNYFNEEVNINFEETYDASLIENNDTQFLERHRKEFDGYLKLRNNKEFMENIIKMKICYIISSNNIDKDRFIWFLEKIKNKKSQFLLYDRLKNFIIELAQFNCQLTPCKLIAFINNFVKNSPFAYIVDGNQQDVHELFQVILYGLHESHSDKLTLDIPKQIIEMPDNIVNSLNINDKIKVKLQKTIYNSYKDSYSNIVHQMHFFNLKLITCRSCKHQSINFDDSSILYAEIPETNENIVSIYDCLESHFAIEPLEDYKCDHCGKKDSILLNKMITQPETLPIALKRFKYNHNNGNSTKNYTNVSYPAILNISKYCPGNGNNENNENNNPELKNKYMYKLKCVLNHIGHVNGGHYYTYCFSNELDNWYNLNDMRVNKIDINKVLENPNAYMLFYEKI